MRIAFAGHAGKHSTMGYRLSPERACARAAGDILLKELVSAFQEQGI